MVSDPVTVYGLARRSKGEIRYIGQTRGPLKVRLANHKSYAKRAPHRLVSKWISAVLAEGDDVQIVVLAEGAERHIDEMRIIAEYRARGVRLLNGTDGGDGFRGPRSAETRLKISLSNRGKPKSAAHVAAYRAAIMAIPAEIRSARSSKAGRALAGRIPKNLPLLLAIVRTPEHRAKISAAHLGIPLSPEHRAKLSAAKRARAHGLAS